MDYIDYSYIAVFVVIAVINFLKTAKNSPAFRIASWTIILVLFTGGLYIIDWQADLIDGKMRFNLQRQTNALAQSINPSHVMQLSFSENDLKKPAYIRMRDQLVTYSKALGLENIYTMKLFSDGSVLFGPESIPSDDPYSTPPGTTYETPSKELYESFVSGKPFTEGPTTDEYGEFVSAISPVFDPATDEVLIMLGVDIDADEWRAKIHYQKSTAAIIVLLLTIILLAINLLLDAYQRNLLLKYRWAKYTEALTVAIIGILITLITALILYQKENIDRDKVFATVSGKEIMNISNDFRGIRDYGFKMLVSYFASSDNISEKEFKSMISSVAGANASKVMMGWAPAVSNEIPEGTRQADQKAGFGKEKVWDKEAFKCDPNLPLEKIKFPLMFLEPVGEMQALLGTDLNSDPYFMRAIKKGIETKQTNEVDPSVKYVSSKNLQLIIAVKPVYSQTSRENELLGFAVGILHTEKFLRGDLYSVNEGNAFSEIDFFQTYPNSPERYILSTDETSNILIHKKIEKFSLVSLGELSFSYPLFVFGNTYMMVARASNVFTDYYQNNAYLFTIIAGMSITAILVFLVLFINRRNVDLERIIEQRTHQLKQNESELRWLFKSMSSAFAVFKTVYDETGDFGTFSFEYVNDAFERMAGFSFGDIQGKTNKELFPEVDNVWCKNFGEVAMQGVTKEFEMYHSGMNKHLNVNAYRPWNTTERFCVIFDDITEKKKAQDKIIRYSKRLELPMKVGNMAWWELNIKTGEIKFDRQKTEMLGYEAKDFSHHSNFTAIIHPEDQERTEVKLRDLLSGKDSNYETEYRIKTKTGDYRWFYEIGAIETRDEEGKPLLITGVSMDITERKKVADEVLRKNQLLIQANSEKDRFFSIISHDLRGPLGSFMTLSQMMAENIEDFDQLEIKKLTEDLKDSATNLYELLENLLSWSKMQQNKIAFEPKRFNLSEIVKKNEDHLANSYKLKGVELITDISEDIEITAERNMIGTVIRNFMSNALKYTRKGGMVIVSAEILANNKVEISVRDTGIGMSKKLMDSLFRLDVKSSRMGTDGEPSTGLGLLLCKDFVEKHGSKINIESRENEGSKFSFVI